MIGFRRAPRGGSKQTKASATRNASAKALEQSATMGAGRWGEGGGEREEREGERTDKYTQVQTRHNKTQTTQGRKKNTTKGESGILRSFEAAVRISFRVGSGVCTYNKSGVPCTTR